MLQNGLYHLHNRAQEEENLRENTTSRPTIAGEERIDVELKSGRRRVGPILAGFDLRNQSRFGASHPHREDRTGETKRRRPAPPSRTAGVGRKGRVGLTGSEPLLPSFDAPNSRITGASHLHREDRTETTNRMGPAPPPETAGRRRKTRVGSAGSGSGRSGNLHSEGAMRLREGRELGFKMKP